MMNDGYQSELGFVNSLNNNDELFEKEFKNIVKDYPFKNYSEIHNFISENRGLIVVLNKARPLLEKYVPYASFHLELDDDPLFTPQLLLVVKALRPDFNNGFKDHIRLIDSKLDPILFNLNLGVEFFIWDTSCTPFGKSALSLRDVYRE